MRASFCEAYFRFVGLVNEKPIWGDVTFALWKPFADERMIAVSSADCLVARIAILMGVCDRPTSQSKFQVVDVRGGLGIGRNGIILPLK